MFNDISPRIVERMRELEHADARDRVDGTPRPERLRQVPSETGKLIALLAATAPPGRYVEIGTSGGYSTLWLALACRSVGRRITTFEVLEQKAKRARETFEATGVGDVVELVCADARDRLADYTDISFCFLDGDKEIYAACYEAIVPNLVPGGILVADNAISHEKILRPMLDRALADERVDAVIVPMGNGELLCRKRSPRD